MKKYAAVLTLGLAALATMPSQAATTATATFNVNITLTSACKVNTVPTAAFTYTSFQATAATFSSAFDILCTNTLPISSVALDSTSVTDSATNLAYTLSLGAVPATGLGVAQSIAITGSMAAGQAGTCLTSSCTNAAALNKQRTITITY
ncbi:MAG: spore coat protein U domain-containing protein [Burkholderiaceae bacterium]